MKHFFPRASVLQVASIIALLLVGVNLRAQTSSASAPPAPAADSAHNDVPVKEVVLFSSGVGYFQHQGSVQGDASTQLRFKTTQINDILKSLVLQDLDGGRVGVVTYPSQDPLEKLLGSFQVDLSGNPSFAELLGKLRGAQVSFGESGPWGVKSGTILGVEQRRVAGAKEGEKPLEEAYLNLVTQKGMVSLPLSSVSTIELDDPSLQGELNRALAAVAAARDQDKKPVDIHFNGQGSRRVRIGYVVETPVWRASYRLVLPPEGDKKDPGTLQGWALVENQTDNDWKNVRLSLVSGRPISFAENLYTPLYVPRPTVVPELYASLKPQEYEGGQAPAVASAPAGPEDGDGGRDVARAGAANFKRQTRRVGITRDAEALAAGEGDLEQAAVPQEAPVSPPLNPSEGVVPITDTSKIGELFQYTVGNVSLPRQTSAMIPIVNDPIAVERVSIYNENVLAKFPLNGARLHNDTEDKLHLLQGPVTVFDDGRYAGDARLDDVPPGQTRLLSYGIDLQTSVIAKPLKDEGGLLTGKIVKGTLEVTRKQIAGREYSLDNQSDHDKTLVIEYPVREGWKLVDTAAPVETTDKLYRFQENLPAGKTDKFNLHEERVYSQTIALLEGNLEYLQYFRQAGEIPVAVRDVVAKVIKLKQDIVDTNGQIEEHDSQVNALSADQNRIRENLKTVDKTSAYSSRLLKKLDDQESQLEKLQQERDALQNKRNDQTRALSEYLNNLNVG